MPKGRIPIPAAIKALRGKRNRRAVPDVAAPPGVPPKPAQLVGEASREWDRIGPILSALRVLSEADLGVLTAYCLSWAEYLGASARLQTAADRVQVGSNGQDVPSVWIKIRREAFDSLMKSAAELGLTPCSRARVAPAAGREASPFDDFLDRGLKLRTGNGQQTA